MRLDRLLCRVRVCGAEGNFVPVEPRFELVFSHADVDLGTCGRRNRGFIYDAACKTGTL